MSLALFRILKNLNDNHDNHDNHDNLKVLLRYFTVVL